MKSWRFPTTLMPNVSPIGAPVSRLEMPRIYELIDLIEDREHPDAYFKKFEQAVAQESEKHRVWREREAEFQELDQESWDSLKAESAPYLTARNIKGRGWEQLISILNQARAYKYMRDSGCSNIRFIPRASKNGIETPDLEGIADSSLVLCEVKTINVSEGKAVARNNGTCTSTEAILKPGFFNKLIADLTKAKSQMVSFNNTLGVRHITFVVVNFDDSLGEYKDWYYEQIDKHLEVTLIPRLEVVLFNQRTCFHKTIQMNNAIIVNE